MTEVMLQLISPCYYPFSLTSYLLLIEDSIKILQFSRWYLKLGRWKEGMVETCIPKEIQYG